MVKNIGCPVVYLFSGLRERSDVKPETYIVVALVPSAGQQGLHRRFFGGKN